MNHRPLPDDDIAASVMTLEDLGTVFFSGIGGSGMSVLAEMLHQAGVPVTGSDRTASSYTKHLESLGIPVIIGQNACNITEKITTVVWSSAIPANSPEMVEALQSGKRLMHRSDILSLLMRTHRSIAVAGTHGKTTTTSMIATIFMHSLMDPSFAIGGSVKTRTGTIPGGRVGNGKWIVAETDESDGSFIKYHPNITIVTNAEGDHLDHYKTVDNYREAFSQFVQHAQEYLILCGDDEGTRFLYRQFPKESLERVYVYSTESYDTIHSELLQLPQDRFVEISNSTEIALRITPDMNLSQETEQERFTLMLPESLRQEDMTGEYSVSLKVPGIHNARNATAAIIASLLSGNTIDNTLRGIESFLGAVRRFDFQGMVNGICLYTDYGHHPTEIKTFIEAARRRFSQSCLRVLFQPHTYSRTQIYTKELVEALSLADYVYVTDIFAARELASDYPGVSSQNLIDEAIRQGKGNQFILVDDKYAGASLIAKQAHFGDILATIGGGDINLVNETILSHLAD
ncbi:MAG: UDP-N-acetylmuramate--L-alanine ligase [Aeriscardovia sp.]|nr:UDP-N-acetylmuramate--L-alanine ligase [Aeriscardovia sp.]